MFDLVLIDLYGLSRKTFPQYQNVEAGHACEIKLAVEIYIK